MSSSELPERASVDDLTRRAKERLRTSFSSACHAGDVATIRRLLATEPELVRERSAKGSTGLHLAVDTWMP